MNDLKEIEKNYKNMTYERLKRLVAQPQDLRLEVIPILQQELLNRSLHTEAVSLANFLKAKAEPGLKDLSYDELKQVVAERLQTGESIESIKIDLKENGVTIFDLIDDENKFREKAFDYIIRLKGQGLNENEINEKMKETLSIDEEASEMLKVQMKKSGKQKLIFGYSITTLAIVLAIFFRRVSIPFAMLLVTGLTQIYRGHDQLKN